MSLLTSFKAILCPGPNQPWQTITVPMREPEPNELFISVHASGICGSDRFVVDGLWPGLAYPRIPGHEIVGRVTALGAGVKDGQFAVGELVGVGWNGGYCGKCEACREGEFWDCELHEYTGVTKDGGHAEYMYALETATIKLPADVLEHATYAEVAPMLCAGVTVFDALRTTRFVPGDICLVQGVGGLGHLAI